jgi:dihydrofolate reductase
VHQRRRLRLHPRRRPVQLADPAFVPGESYDFPAFQKRCDSVLVGRTTFEPAVGAKRWPWPGLDVFVLGSRRPDGTPREVVVERDPKQRRVPTTRSTARATAAVSASR